MESTSWTREDLVKALKLRGYTLSKVAKDLKISYATVRYGLEKGAPPELRALVSEIISTDEWIIWPGLFPPQWREAGPPVGKQGAPSLISRT